MVADRGQAPQDPPRGDRRDDRAPFESARRRPRPAGMIAHARQNTTGSSCRQQASSDATRADGRDAAALSEAQNEEAGTTLKWFRPGGGWCVPNSRPSYSTWMNPPASPTRRRGARFDLNHSNGQMPHDQMMRSIEPMSREVVPCVHALLATVWHRWHDTDGRHG